MPRLVRSLALVATLTALPALAADLVIKNDNFSGSGSVATPVDFSDYAGGGVLFELDAGMYPVTLSAVDVFCAPYPGVGNTSSIGAWLIDVWDEGAAVSPPTATYGNRFSGANGGTQLNASTSSLNRYVFANGSGVPTPIVINSGKFFIGVREQQSTQMDGTTIAMDTGPVVPGANWYFNGFGYWFPVTGQPDAGTTVGTINRNWIIRAVLTVPGNNPDSGVIGTGGGGGSIGAGGGGGGSGGSGGGTGGSGGAGGGSLGSGGGQGGVGNVGGLHLDSVDPPTINAAESTDLTVLGGGFDPDVQLLIGTKLIPDISRKSAAVISVTVKPHSLTAGTYDVKVINGDGTDSVLKDGITVVEGAVAPAGCSCNSVVGSELVVLLAIGLLRRRRAA